MTIVGRKDSMKVIMPYDGCSTEQIERVSSWSRKKS